MDRQVWSGSSQLWWRLMGGWGDKSGEGGEEAAFVRRDACWKAGKIDGERSYRKVNQGSTEMMSTEHASVTKWRREKRRAGRENVAKGDLWKEEIRERKEGWRGWICNEGEEGVQWLYCICGARRKKQEMGLVPLCFHKHFTDPPQPLKSIGAQSHSVLRRPFHRVHNNYHPTLTHSCNITDSAQSRRMNERHGTGRINTTDAQAQLIAASQFIMAAISAEFYPNFVTLKWVRMSEWQCLMGWVSWNISTWQPKICHSAVTPTLKTQGFIFSKWISIVTHWISLFFLSSDNVIYALLEQSRHYSIFSKITQLTYRELSSMWGFFLTWFYVKAAYLFCFEPPNLHLGFINMSS